MGKVGLLVKILLTPPADPLVRLSAPTTTKTTLPPPPWPTRAPTAKTLTSVAAPVLSVLPREVPAVLLTPLARASTLTKAPRRLPSTRRLCLPTTPRPPTSVPPWAPTGDSAEKPRPPNMLALTLRNLNTSCKVGLLVKILLTLPADPLVRLSTPTTTKTTLPPPPWPTRAPTAKTLTSVAAPVLSVLPREVPAVLLTPLARASTLTKAPRRLPSTRRLCLPTTPRPPTSV